MDYMKWLLIFVLFAMRQAVSAQVADLVITDNTSISTNTSHAVSSISSTEVLSTDRVLAGSFMGEDHASTGKQADGPIYKLKPKVDIPLTAVTTAWSLYAFTRIYSKDPSTDAEILALNKENINAFDRSGATVYSPSAKKTSDYLFYGSMPLPLVLMIDNKIRKDAARVGFLYLQAMGITGFLYTGSVFLVDRYRPLAYNPEVDFETRKRGGAKNSFFAGHVALVATSTFFCASVYDHYNPRSNLKWVFYSAATAATVATGYLRYKGGQHFRSDILLGIAVGTLSGLYVPRTHLNKFLADKNMSLVPFTNGEQNGLALRYHLP